MYNQILSFLYSLPPIPLIYENDWKLGKNLQIKLVSQIIRILHWFPVLDYRCPPTHPNAN